MSVTLDAIATLARRRAPIAPPVLDVLEAQNARWGPSAARRAHLDALAAGAVVIATGQQLGVCLGPLYTIYKAASAIRLARELGRMGIPAVPLFWLQAEDHDFEEIRTTHFVANDALVAASLPERPAERARASIAHELVGAGIRDVLAALEPSISASSEGAAFFARLSSHYRPEATMVDAFGGLLAELFEPHGLLTLEPRDPALATLAAPLHRRALEDHASLARALVAEAQRIEAAGGRAPIAPRPDCALSFFHPHGPRGGRFRIVPRGDELALSGSPETFTRAEVLGRLEADPLVMSTSGLLRPLLQDHLLPTAAYVGGPTEVAYAAQLAPLYRHFDAEMAPFVRRASFVVTGPEDRRTLEELGLERAERGADEATLTQRRGQCALGERLEQLAQATRAQLAALGPGLEELDPGLGKSVDKTDSAIEQALSKLKGRVERAAASRSPERLATLRHVRAQLRPGGAPQERVLGVASVASLGVRRVVDAAVEAAMEVSTGGAASFATGEVELRL